MPIHHGLSTSWSCPVFNNFLAGFTESHIVPFLSFSNFLTKLFVSWFGHIMGFFLSCEASKTSLQPVFWFLACTYVIFQPCQVQCCHCLAKSTAAGLLFLSGAMWGVNSQGTHSPCLGVTFSLGGLRIHLMINPYCAP